MKTEHSQPASPAPLPSGPGSDFADDSAPSEPTKKAFCSYHQGFALEHEGALLQRGKIKRWMCGPCMKLRRITPPAR